MVVLRKSICHKWIDLLAVCLDSDIDGINQWAPLRNGDDSKRQDMVYNLDLSWVPVTGAEAIRYSII